MNNRGMRSRGSTSIARFAFEDTQLTLITWKGRNYYVQPDSTNQNLAWVGSPAEFQAYQQLRLARQLSNENLMAARMNQAAMMSWRGAWGPGFYGGFGRWR